MPCKPVFRRSTDRDRVASQFEHPATTRYAMADDNRLRLRPID